MSRVAEVRRPTAAAWAASLAAHTLLTAGAVWWGGERGLEPGGDTPTREVGIVLRQADRPPSPFETESVADTETVEPVDPTETTEPVDEPLPPSPFSDLLADLLEERPEGAGPEAGAPPSSETQPPPAGGGRPDIPIGQARVPFFGVEGVGSRFVFALDRSTSMQAGRMRAAKAELIASLAAIGPSHQFNILFFNTRVVPLDLTGQQRTAYGTDENKRRAERFVRGVTADGGTERKTALDHALRLRPDVIFFLTDDETPMTAGEMAEILEEAAGGVTIHTVEFGHGPDRGDANFLTELAARTGGRRVYVDTTLLPR